jgi:iron complex transport system permease protein
VSTPAATTAPRTAMVTGLLVLLTLALFAVSVFAGRTSLLLHALTGGHGMDGGVPWLILTEIRLPRALLAVLVGASLGLSGAVLQGFLRNPLAEPALIGASSTAALGAVLVLYTGLSASVSWALPLGGMAGAVVGMALVGVLAGPGTSVLTLILAGVAVNSLAGALTALALNLAPSPFASLEIVFWLLGSLADRSFDQVRLALPFMLAGWALLLPLSRTLDALTLGDEAARSMGFDLRRARVLVILGTGLSVGASVAVSGVVGFVGLVVPHLLRPLVGHRPGALPALSALGGAALTLAADIAARLLSPDQELKLGVVTAMVGAPFFLHLLMRLRRELT